MFRKLAVVAALLIVASPRLFALGLGEIDMKSALNQPMQAVINLTHSAGTPLESIKVSLASLEAHQRVGMTKAALLANFKFKVEQGRDGNAVVRVSSTDPVREPYLEFLLELEWPNGRLLRQYTVLVDPPVTMPATPAVPPAPVSRAVSRPATPAPVRQVPAPSVRPAPATVASAPAPAPAAEEYGPIRRSETLWSIAERVKPDSGISTHQMMLALQRANPDAFVNGNMNLLKAGSTLKVPGRDAITAVSAREALAETQRQYSEWQAAIEPATADEAAETPVPGPYAEAEAAAVPAESDTGARLQLVAPEGDAVEGAAMPGDPDMLSGEPGDLADLNQQLALATEEAEASKAESAELQSRVVELEQQIDTMKRLLELKDNALASLQNEVESGDEGAAGMPAETAEPVAAAETPASEPVPETAAAGVDAAADDAAAEPQGTVAALMSRVMDNPILAGAGLLVALLLGGFLWLANRQKTESDMFEEEMTLASQLASDSAQSGRNWPTPVFDVEEETPDTQGEEEPIAHDNSESNPITESEVYLAYGRIQQAEDVLQAALQQDPGNDDIRVKLLEVYHIAGNTAAFEQAASDFRDGVEEDDARWIKVATLGYAMAPDNPLYRAGAPADLGEPAGERHADAEPDDNTIEFDMDLSGMETVSDSGSGDEFGLELEKPSTPAADETEGLGYDHDQPADLEYGLDQPEGLEYGLDQLEDEDGYDGTLASEDEVTTKLDLARAYIDMDDRDSARSILGEVMEEGNPEQKQEAEKIFAQIA